MGLTDRSWKLVGQSSSMIFTSSDDFHKGCIDLSSINASIITLIPKNGTNDFRPISLLNSCLKLLTKLLADRLQERILELVHRNQYGFIKTRTLQDCLAWSF